MIWCAWKRASSHFRISVSISRPFYRSYADPAAPANAFPASLSPHSQSFRAGIKRPSKSLRLLLYSEFSCRITVKDQASLSQALIILPGLTGRCFPETDSVLFQDPADICTLIQHKITAQDCDTFRICFPLRYCIIHGTAQLLIRVGPVFCMTGSIKHRIKKISGNLSSSSP